MSDSGQVVIGLAGHIDHGKTALVQALTGVDTDTHAEEKQRGMTIDIGFAFLTDSITLVDVPGHDRFIKNMVRGVAGIHIGLLLVAADDGVMTQTREHLHILSYLGIPRLCVAISKVDLVEADWLDLVEDDIRSLLSGTSYEGSPIIRVSAITKEGVEDLREVLEQEAAQASPWEDRGFFRLPIDRVFSLKGFGTIVTGTVISGSLQQGDTVELLPGRQEVKLRGIQSHGGSVAGVRLGDRAALNITNLSVQELRRGEQIATPGSVATPRSIAVDLHLLAEAPSLPHNHPVRVNVGTAEVMARIRLVAKGPIRPGTRAGAVLDLQDPVPVIRGDRFILRSFSPVTTIGGGIILDVDLPRRWRDVKRWTTQLAAVSPADQLSYLIEEQAGDPFTLKTLAARWGWSVEKMRNQIPQEVLRIGRDENPWLMTPPQAEALTARIREVVGAYHQSQPYSRGANREYIRQKVNGDERFLESWLRKLVEQQHLQAQGEMWSLPDFDIQLSDADADGMDKLVATVEAQGFQTEYIEVLAERLDIPMERLTTLCVLAENQGRLVRLNQRIMIHTHTMERLLGAVERHFREHRELTVGDVKDMTGTTRKYTVPLLEYLDRTGHTLRVGDKRVRPDG
ncbi:MAG: selenocysteine-specific translation elongation factor [Fidelibacterota bacterium]|nr:MAG: selenocysteine-specific translation elongation factor [Candidatus Neomarinimicrobiota bacterium]